MFKIHDTAQRKYDVFCRNRTVELYNTFFELVGAPDLSGAEYVEQFTGCVPFPGTKNARPVNGMAKHGSIMHGVVRYEYKADIVEECRKDGKEHGLRVVVVQTGDIWIRLHSDGNRLAQIALNADYSIKDCPKPIDEGGLEQLRSHLHLIQECFEAKPEIIKKTLAKRK